MSLMSSVRPRIRVKMFSITKCLWKEEEAGFISVKNEENRSHVLVVTSEFEEMSIVELGIQQEVPYKQQQESITLWYDDCEYGYVFSFQEQKDCDEIWMKICDIQGVHTTVNSTKDLIDTSETVSALGPGSRKPGLTDAEFLITANRLKEYQTDTFNEHIVDIIGKLRNDGEFWLHLFVDLVSSGTSIYIRRKLLSILKDLFHFVGLLQSSLKESYFSFLFSKGALKSIFFCLKLSHVSFISTCFHIIQIFIENHTSLVREFCIIDYRENINSTIMSNYNDYLYINVLIYHMIHDKDLELCNRLVITNMLKLLLDPKIMISSGQQKVMEFLNFFYKHSISYFVKPLIDFTDDNQLRYIDYHTAKLIHNILELFAFCVEFHPHNMKKYAYSSNIMMRIVTLFKSQHEHVVLAALLVIRKFVGSKKFYYRYIIKNNILSHVVELLNRNDQYNMINSAIMELFEFIRFHEIHCLMCNVINNHWEQSLQHHNYVAVFKRIEREYDDISIHNIY